MKKTAIGLILAFAALGAASQAAAAQAQPAGCTGYGSIVRVSKIKPGQMALFLKATKDQEAWYAKRGIKDSFYVLRVADGKAVSATEVVSVHINGPEPRQAADAEWNAFVKEFRDSSDIVSEKPGCVAAR